MDQRRRLEMVSYWDETADLMKKAERESKALLRSFSNAQLPMTPVKKSIYNGKTLAFLTGRQFLADDGGMLTRSC